MRSRACIVVAGLSITAFSIYAHFAGKAPETPSLETYTQKAPAISRIYAADGTLLGEFAEEWRELATYEEIPKPLVHAFLAIEDHRFFEHHGIDAVGIARAIWRNLTAGDFAQGGSTITQQLTKQFLSSEKSLTRKALEAIVARRLEAKYSKEAILTVYLNQIYLGYGAYGVRAAAKRYFSKDLGELDVSEMAMIAGLAQAPSRFSPVNSTKRATARRNVVLETMASHGFIDAAAADEWKEKPLTLQLHRDFFGDVMPYYSEHLRRYLTKKYGQDALMKQGLRVEAAAEPVTEAIGYENIIHGARKQDKRQGWRGPEAHLDGKARQLFIDRAAKMYSDTPLVANKRYLGLVEEVESRRAKVRVGKTQYRLPLRNMRWASKWKVRPAVNDITISNAKRALSVGDVVWVRRPIPLTAKFREWHIPDGANPRWRPALKEKATERFIKDNEGAVELEQVSHPQSALFTADHHSAYVLSIVGGVDSSRSEFNRAIQACRQPGSTYKPIYYSTALDEAHGYGFDTRLNDIPRAEVDPVTGEIWTPENLGGTVDNSVSLEYALVFSKNVPSVDIFKKIGAENVEKWARRLGFTTKIIADKALALGASCTVLPELTRAFAIFARNGRWLDWVYARRILDREGNIIEDNTQYYDPMLPPSEQLDRLSATAGLEIKQAIPARTAFLTAKLLSQAMVYGFASVVRQTGINAAGKTGTSSATMDTSFVGFTSRWITAVWLGDDIRERPLGVKDAAYMTVVPMWSRFMYEAAQGHPNREIPWEVPEGVNPKSRGGRKGARGPMSLVYKSHAKPKPPEE